MSILPAPSLSAKEWDERNDEARMSNDGGMTNLMNLTHSLSLALLLKPNGAGARERAGLEIEVFYV